MSLVFSVFTSRLTSLLASNRTILYEMTQTYWNWRDSFTRYKHIGRTVGHITRGSYFVLLYGDKIKNDAMNGTCNTHAQ